MKLNFVKLIFLIFLLLNSSVISIKTDLEKISSHFSRNQVQNKRWFKTWVLNLLCSLGNITYNNQNSIKEFIIQKAWKGVKLTFKNVRKRQTYIERLVDDPVSYISRSIFESINNYLNKTPVDNSLPCNLKPDDDDNEEPFKIDLVKNPIPAVFTFMKEQIQKNQVQVSKAFLTVLIRFLTPIGSIAIKESKEAKDQSKKEQDEIVKYQEEVEITIKQVLEKCYDEGLGDKIDAALLSFADNLRVQFIRYKVLADMIQQNLHGNHLTPYLIEIKNMIASTFQAFKSILEIMKNSQSCFKDVYLKLAEKAEISYFSILGKIVDHTINTFTFWSQIKGIIHTFFHVFETIDLYVFTVEWMEQIHVVPDNGQQQNKHLDHFTVDNSKRGLGRFKALAIRTGFPSKLGESLAKIFVYGIEAGLELLNISEMTNILKDGLFAGSSIAKNTALLAKVKDYINKAYDKLLVNIP